MDAFEEQRKKIEAALHEFYVQGKQVFDNNYSQMLQWFDHNTNAFKTGLEIVKLQFALGKMDAADEAESLKKELNTKLHELGVQYHEAQKMAIDNLEAFAKQMKDGYEAMRRMTESWMKK